MRITESTTLRAVAVAVGRALADHGILTVLLALSSSQATVSQPLAPGCRALAATDHRLWILEAGQAPRALIAVDGAWAAFWSPDGTRIAYSDLSKPAAVDFIDVEGRPLGSFAVEAEPPTRVRYVDAIEWRDARTLLVYGNHGPNGGYLDVFRLPASGYAAQRWRHILLLGRSWTVSPSLHYLAQDPAAIDIYDLTLPPDDLDVVDHPPVFKVPSLGDVDNSGGDWGVGLVWAPKDTLVFSVRGLGDRRFLTVVEEAPTAAGGWRVTDYELSGLDGKAVAMEARSNRELVIATATAVFRIDLDALTPARGAVAERIPGGSMRRPAFIEISEGKKTTRYEVLDTHCSS